MMHGEEKICRDCMAIFDEAEVYEEEHGERFSVCPYCGGEWEYAVRCAGCGESYLEDSLTEGFCPECVGEIRGRFRRALSEFNEEELDLLNEIYDGERIA